MTNESPSYHGYRFPPEIISYAVWFYHRAVEIFAQFLQSRGLDDDAEQKLLGRGDEVRRGAVGRLRIMMRMDTLPT